MHGRADLLTQCFECIDADIVNYPAPQIIQVLLGDYIDRGPQSRQVLDLLVRRSHHQRVVCLKGNHETYIADFLQEPRTFNQWRHFGGAATLISYGVMPSLNADKWEQRELALGLDRALPRSHLRLLAGLKASFACGDYFFVHAGVRPGLPLSCQREEDLLWIREEFLSSEEDFGKFVIHGHTPVMEPDIRPNRMNIDTGAYATGRLTCLALEDESITLI